MKLLGVHVMGELATEIVHIGMMAMLGGHTVDVFDNTCFNIPTLGALYKVAAFDAAFRASNAATDHPLEVNA
jgi:NAD(P) transhydrogenase